MFLALAAAPAAQAQFVVHLEPATLQQFEKYQKTVVDPIEEQRVAGKRSFLWVDESREHHARARKGEVVTQSFSGRDGLGVTNGLIHDWIGVVFIPGTTLDQARDFLQDQERHEKVYSEIVRARTVSTDGNTSITAVRMKKKKVLTVVLDVEYENSWNSPSSDRWVLRAITRKVTEVRNAGNSSEQPYPPGEGHGFLWRMNSEWRLLERDGGTWVELRVVSLSRDTPSSLGWIVRPIIRDFPSDSLDSTLIGMRDALKH